LNKRSFNVFYRKQDSVVAREHTKALEKQLIKTEQSEDNEESKLTQENVERNFSENKKSSRRQSASHEDNFSSASFKSSNTGFTGATAFENQAKISKENIIYQKYV